MTAPTTPAKGSRLKWSQFVRKVDGGASLRLEMNTRVQKTEKKHTHDELYNPTTVDVYLVVSGSYSGMEVYRIPNDMEDSLKDL